MTVLNPDRSIFLVLCRYGDLGLAWAERDVARTCRTCTLEDIRSGELPYVEQVIEFNVAEGWSRDVTADMVVEARHDEIRSKVLSQLAIQDHMNKLVREWVDV
jgi:hypothetical protein